jgi:hypothetical protein
MKIFELENNIVTFAPQALLLKPFKALWERDKSKGKKRAKDELAYIWYMEDVRSDFYDIVSEDERRVEVLKFLTELPPTYTPDKEVQEAIKEYCRLSEGMATKILKDTMIMVNNLRKAMVEMDFEERDKSGKPVYDYGRALDLASKIPNLLKSLKETYREIEREAEEQHLMRGGRKKATFEDGI